MIQPRRRYSGRSDDPRTDADRAALVSVLADLGITGVSSLVVDADEISFAGFDLLRRLVAPDGARARRQLDGGHADSIEARIEDGVVLCRGTLAGGAAFGCRAEEGWLRIFGLEIEIMTTFRGTLRQMVDNQLLAMREYHVTSAHVVAGTTVLKFKCPIVSPGGLSPVG